MLGAIPAIMLRAMRSTRHSDGLAPFATDPSASRGRLFPEAPASHRTAFQRDRDRIIHSAAFRRLKHKTQVFVAHEGDHYRTRLTHSLEVSQIARTISRTLGLDEDLAETLALAHDLGHTPFGHAGEDTLNERMAPFGGFDHNAQTLRIVTRLEAKYAEFDGLNLTWETLEGIVKHNGPLVGATGDGAGAGGDNEAVPEPIRDYNALQDLEIDTWPGPEAQVAALSDDIAYNNHDLDDGLRAGLFSLDDICAVPMVDEAVIAVREDFGAIEPQRQIHEVIRRLIGEMVEDLLTETRRRVTEFAPETVDGVRTLGKPLVAFSADMQRRNAELKQFLNTHMYRHYKVNRMTSKAHRIVAELFDLFIAEPGVLPPPWAGAAAAAPPSRAARIVADYIAGMTDRFALDEHHRLFDAII